MGIRVAQIGHVSSTHGNGPVTVIFISFLFPPVFAVPSDGGGGDFNDFDDWKQEFRGNFQRGRSGGAGRGFWVMGSGSGCRVMGPGSGCSVRVMGQRLGFRVIGPGLGYRV